MIVFAGLAVFSSCALKESPTGVMFSGVAMVSGEVPTSERLVTCGLVMVSSTTCNWPSRVPPMVGLNWT